MMGRFEWGARVAFAVLSLLASGAVVLTSSAMADTNFPPTSVTQESSGPGTGGTVYRYPFYSGYMEYRIPPAGFDFATATAAQRAYYGIPPQPPASEPDAQQAWWRLVDNYHMAPAPPYLTKLDHPATRALPHPTQLEPAGDANGGTWAGIVDASSPFGAQTYSAAWTNIYEPEASTINWSQCVNPKGDTAAWWAGLGGVLGDPNYPDPALTQIGANDYQYSGSSPVEDYAWAEEYPLPVQKLNWSATQGDEYAWGMIYEGDINGDHEFEAIAYDWTTGVSHDFTFYLPQRITDPRNNNSIPS
jgi:hypothetical protein